jgi:hypothetical protein
MTSVQSYLPPRAQNLLFIEWVLYFAHERLGISQWGSGGQQSQTTMTNSEFTVGSPTDLHITIKRTPDDSRWHLAISDPRQEEALQYILAQANDRTSRNDLGSGVWYSTVLTTSSLNFLSDFGLQFARTLGDQVRIIGSRRLSDRVLLEFSEEAGSENEPMPFAPQTSIEVDVLAPGPTAGPFSDEIAGDLVETVRVICTFALGRPVDGPLALFSSDEEKAEAARQKQHHSSILDLARNYVSLDLFGYVMSYGGPESVLKARNALLTYDAALRQANHDVATILFVTAIEALIPPPMDWRKERVTARFVIAVQELCPQALEEILAHANSELAFGPIKQRQNRRKVYESLLGRIYDMRSSPVHAGLSITPRLFAHGSGADATMRIALLSDLTRAAILAFIQAPRNFLVGHPVLYPGSV